MDFGSSVREASRNADASARKSYERGCNRQLREIEAEILRVLTAKFAWESTRARAALDTVLARAVRVQLRGTVKKCRDPNDDMFLECAMRAKADLLIAGDKDLLVLGSYKGTRILTPAEYVVGAG